MTVRDNKAIQGIPLKAFKKTLLIGIIFLVLIPSDSYAERTDLEKYYQNKWCEAIGGKPNRFNDQTECDCQTATHAIEFDFGKKWKEAIGQSLHYSLKADKKAGIVLIMDGSKTDKKYYNSLHNIISHFRLPVDIWVVFKDDSKTDKKHWNSLNNIIEHFGLPVDVWTEP